MVRLPPLSAREAMRALERCGFEIRSTKGSHVKLVHPGPPRRIVIVPAHASHDLPRGTLKSIIEQSGLSEEAFLEALR